MELFQTAEERRIHVMGFALNWPEPRRECWNAGLRLAEPAVRREYWPPALIACASEREMGFGILECWVNGKIRHITRIQWILRKNSRILGYCEKIRISPPSILYWMLFT